MTSVTAALIVRNEQRFLPDCLRSLQNCVDEVVIVDTGSTDNTRDIVEAAGISVVDFKWNGDFSAARNAALGRVTTPWTLYIDADERVSVPHGNPISQHLNLAEQAGGLVRFRPRPGYTRYREPRLFRTDPAIRFRGRIHETIVPDLNAFADTHGLTIPSTPVCIDHLGFEGDQSHKVTRNVPLLEAELKTHPERAYCWHHLAEMLVLDGRSQEAIATCRKGLASTEDGRSEKSKTDRRQLAQTLARLLIEEREDALGLVETLLSDDPDDFATLYLKGRALLLADDPVGALHVGERLAAVDPDALEDSLVAYDMRLFGEFAWALRGAAHYQAGQRREAGEAYQRAWRHAPGNMSYLGRAAGLGARVGRDNEPKDDERFTALKASL